MIFLLSFLMIPAILSGMEGDTPDKNSGSYGEYDLVVKGNDISLKARDASLKNILEEIGRRMNIDVVADIPREDKITVDLDMMYLGDAIKKFKKNYAYITESDKDKGKITKIFVVPKGMEKMLPGKYEYNPQPPIQKFKHDPQSSYVGSGYDPQPPVQKYEPRHQRTIVRPDHKSPSSSATAENEPPVPDDDSEYNPQPSLAGHENNSQSDVIGSENDPESPDNESDSTPLPPDVASEYNPQPPVQ